MTAVPEQQAVRRADGIELRLGLKYDLLMYAWARWRGEGLFPLIFPRQPNMTLWEFLDWNYLPTVEPVGCFREDELLGIGWICQAYQLDQGVAAEVGAGFFKGTPMTVWHGALDQFLHHAFEDRGFVEIYGLSVEDNLYSKAMLRHCGMHQVAALPWTQGVPADTRVFMVDRLTWQAKRRLRELT
jgi:hypothetical protein